MIDTSSRCRVGSSLSENGRCSTHTGLCEAARRWPASRHVAINSHNIQRADIFTFSRPFALIKYSLSLSVSLSPGLRRGVERSGGDAAGRLRVLCRGVVHDDVGDKNGRVQVIEHALPQRLPLRRPEARHRTPAECVSVAVAMCQRL